MQRLIQFRSQSPAYRWLAGLCCMLVLLAGTFASNPAWHDALHPHAEAAGTGQSGDADSPGHTDESSCAICAFAHQQVSAGWVSPVTVPMPVPYVVAERSVPPVVPWEMVWPEPSGRGPPVGV